jgi:WD40 repeat protein
MSTTNRRTTAIKTNIPGIVRHIAWSPSGLRIAVCTDQSSVILARSAQAGPWKKTHTIPVDWTEVCFSPRGDYIAGFRQSKDGPGQGIEVVRLKGKHASSPVMAGHLPEVNLNENTALLPFAGNRVLLIPVGVSIDGSGRSKRALPIGSRDIYDLTSGPLLGGGYINVHQEYDAMGPHAIMVVFETTLSEVSQDGRRVRKIAWDPKKRILGIQAVGKDEIWLELYWDDNSGSQTLRRYRRINNPGH